MSGFVTPNTPNVTDYTTFLQTSVGIPVSALPADSPWITYAFNQGLALTAYIPTITPIVYVLAVYNCATHLQIKITPDQPAQTYFSTLRGSGEGGFNLVGVPTSVLSGSADQGTSQAMAVPESLKNLTLTDLDFMRTPWGRDWIQYGQDIGPLWGLA